MAALVNGFEEAGTHEARSDATNVSSGVYFYILKAASFVETRKMVLSRSDLVKCCELICVGAQYIEPLQFLRIYQIPPARPDLFGQGRRASRLRIVGTQDHMNSGASTNVIVLSNLITT